MKSTFRSDACCLPPKIRRGFGATVTDVWRSVQRLGSWCGRQPGALVEQRATELRMARRFPVSVHWTYRKRPSHRYEVELLSNVVDRPVMIRRLP